MAEMTPQQQNLLRYLVPLLQAKESAQAAVGPSALGTVLDMILPSSQTVEKMSYGDMPFRMPTQSRIPITTDKQYLADLIGVAGALTPAAKPVQRGVQQLVREIQTTAPKGSIDVTGLPNRGRDVIQSSAEDLSSKLKQLGFQAEVTHSGSAAGPSSYVKVYDPQTGRFFNQPIRFSGHSKGTFNQAEVRDVNDPSVDLPKIIEDALAMRSQGPSKTFQKQAIVDELIAGGMKPKQAYAQAEQRMVGLLEPQAVQNPLYQLTKEEFLGNPKIISPKSSQDLKPRTLTTNVDVTPEPFMGGKYDVKMSEDGAAVLDGDKVIASYNFGKTLVVDPKYRKQGIAEELVYQWRSRYPGAAQADTRTKASQRVQEKVWDRIQNEKFVAESNM